MSKKEKAETIMREALQQIESECQDVARAARKELGGSEAEARAWTAIVRIAHNALRRANEASR